MNAISAGPASSNPPSRRRKLLWEFVPVVSALLAISLLVFVAPWKIGGMLTFLGWPLVAVALGVTQLVAMRLGGQPARWVVVPVAFGVTQLVAKPHGNQPARPPAGLLRLAGFFASLLVFARMWSFVGPPSEAQEAIFTVGLIAWLTGWWPGVLVGLVAWAAAALRRSPGGLPRPWAFVRAAAWPSLVAAVLSPLAAPAVHNVSFSPCERTERVSAPAYRPVPNSHRGAVRLDRALLRYPDEPVSPGQPFAILLVGWSDEVQGAQSAHAWAEPSQGGAAQVPIEFQFDRDLRIFVPPTVTEPPSPVRSMRLYRGQVILPAEGDWRITVVIEFPGGRGEQASVVKVAQPRGLGALAGTVLPRRCSELSSDVEDLYP